MARWSDVFRPGFNLDLLQSLPSLMARHWLIRREVLARGRWLPARLQQGAGIRPAAAHHRRGWPGRAGPSGRAAADLPVRRCWQENAHERQALIRHLATRGYQAQVSSRLHLALTRSTTVTPNVRWCRSSCRARTTWSICNGAWSACLQRTRYSSHEVLIADNHSQSAELLNWLDSLEGNGRPDPCPARRSSV